MAIQLDNVFLVQTNRLIEHGTETGLSITEGLFKTWLLPDGYVGNILNPQTIGGAFSREGLNTAVPLVFLYGGTVGDEMACRVQTDYLSAQERAFRLRHSTSIRCSVHAAGRRLGHGNYGGPIAQVIDFAQNLVLSGT